MKRDCNTCIYKEGSCYPSTTIFDKDKSCKSYIPDYEGYVAELEKENAELDCQKNRNKSCYSCVNATERCFRNEIGCPCQKYKFWKEENTELKLKLEALEGQTPWKDIKDKSELIKENAKLKDNFKIAKDNEYEYSSLLTKAKELLTRFVMTSVYFNGKETDLVERAEQFLEEEY